jgi:hypothetical protein
MNVRQVLLLAMSAGLVACASTPKFVNEDYELNLSDEEYRSRLEDWFNCDECVNGQLRRVQELGNAAVPDLADARDGEMIQVGGIDLLLADNDAVLDSKCTRVAVDSLPMGVTAAQTADECIERFQANRDRRYRGRAGIALLAIRTESACAELGVDANEVPVCKVFKPFEPIKFTPKTSRSTRQMVP